MITQTPNAKDRPTWDAVALFLCCLAFAATATYLLATA